jgi:HlyD family secretion protein
VTVVGSLIGLATIEAVPKVNGRLEAVYVRLGDRVNKGQRIAKIEDSQIVEQVKQAQAAYQVAAATIRQREADLQLATTNLERAQNLSERQLIPKQTFDDTQSRHQAALAQLDLAKAQYAQAQARIDELKATLADTEITSPVSGFIGKRALDPGAWVTPNSSFVSVVDISIVRLVANVVEKDLEITSPVSGFIGKRALDPGAWVTPNSSFVSVVDISIVRLVANVVEKDLRKIMPGLRADVEADALPGEKFTGRVARVAPVLDPATRTAQIEVEIENPQYRLKPGMYSKVHFAVDAREKALVIPTEALVEVRSDRGVFVPAEGEQGNVATFKKLEIGLIGTELVEVTAGLSEGERVVTTGAAALREGDRILLPGENPAAGGGSGRGGPGRGGPGGQGGRQGGGAGRRGDNPGGAGRAG